MKTDEGIVMFEDQGQLCMWWMDEGPGLERTNELDTCTHQYIIKCVSWLEISTSAVMSM